jgi:glutamate synthase domain-containing protein 2
MALGANGIAVSNSGLQAIGCLSMRACHPNHCPVGIATQQDRLADFDIEDLTTFKRDIPYLTGVAYGGVVHR